MHACTYTSYIEKTFCATAGYETSLESTKQYNTKHKNSTDVQHRHRTDTLQTE